MALLTAQLLLLFGGVLFENDEKEARSFNSTSVAQALLECLCNDGKADTRSVGTAGGTETELTYKANADQKPELSGSSREESRKRSSRNARVEALLRLNTSSLENMSETTQQLCGM